MSKSYTTWSFVSTLLKLSLAFMSTFSLDIYVISTRKWGERFHISRIYRCVDSS